MNTFLHILNNFPAKLVFFQNNKEIFSVLSTQFLGDEINLRIDELANFKISVYPLNTTFLPYSLSFVKADQEIRLLSDFATIYPLPESNFVLDLKKISISKDDIIGDKIEIDSFDLKKLSFLNDLKGRGRVETFSVSENKLIKKDNYFVFLNKNQQKMSNNLILLDFFQSIFAEDFSSAKQLLSPSFSSILNKETIKTFFGKFKSCKLVNYYSTPCVVLFYEDFAKVFGAKIVEDKICDIYQIN